MKRVKKLSILAIIFLILGLIVSLGSGSTNAQKFDPHDPIEIIGNSDFIEYAMNETWDGDGSQTTPYIIEGLSLTDIIIRNTDVHFEIKDIQVASEEEFGISLYNVSHGTISGNTLENSYKGAILLDSSVNNSIINNIIKDNEISGIRMLKSHNNTLTGNTISNNGGTHDGARVCGLFMENSHENILTDNILDDNAHIGINLPLSNYNLISENTISNHRVSGIDMVGGTGIQWNYMWGDYNTITQNQLYLNGWGIGIRGTSNTISKNTIFKNSIGIYVGLDNFATSVGLLDSFTLQSDATNTEIVSNEIYNNSIGLVFERSINGDILKNSIYFNSHYGLTIKSPSSGTNVKQNDFLANNLEGISQALDNGTSNTFLENYWYEWTSPDSDSDTFVDEPYIIDGSASNTDSSPLADVFNSNSPTDLVPPQPKASSGWTFSLLLLTIIPMIIVRKRKK